MKTKGALPSVKKPADQRLGHRASTGLVVVPQRMRRVPIVPKEYAPAVKARWRAFWHSSVSQAVDPDADMPALLRWAWALNEWEATAKRIQLASESVEEVDSNLGKIKILDGGPTAVGSMGQRVLSPYVSYMQMLERMIGRAEVEFGMTSLARSRLSLTIGEAKLTAAELRKSLSREGGAALPAEAWEGEWSEA